MDKLNVFRKKVLWWEDIQIELFGQNDRRYVWRSKGEALKPQSTVPAVKRGDGNILHLLYCNKVDGIMTNKD